MDAQHADVGQRLRVEYRGRVLTTCLGTEDSSQQHALYGCQAEYDEFGPDRAQQGPVSQLLPEPRCKQAFPCLAEPYRYRGACSGVG